MNERDGVRLEGGNMGEVLRVGDAVVKTAGPWTPQVHAAMHALRETGASVVPRPLGIDGDRERITFLEGTVPDYPLPSWVWSDELLLRTAGQLRQLHDAADSINVPATGWRRGTIWPPTLLCHGDVAPYNTVFDGVPEAPRAIAFIDWDFAVVGPREWDLGYFAYRWVTLTPPGHPDGNPSPPAEQRRRLDLLCDAYGDTTASDIVTWAVRRLHDMVGYSRRKAAQGSAEFQATIDAGDSALYLADAEWISHEYRELLPKQNATLLIRRAEPDESAEVARVLIDSRRAAFPLVPASAHSDPETNDWVSENLIPSCDVWVATADAGQVVGVAALQQDWVEQLYVLPDLAGQGIGSQLLDVAKALSPSGLQLWTFVSNTAARAFYERHGFVVVEETDGTLNEEGEPDMRLVWQP